MVDNRKNNPEGLKASDFAFDSELAKHQEELKNLEAELEESK